MARVSSRVVATGYGVVTSTGSDRVSFTRALREGVRGMGPVTLFDVSDQKTAIGAEVKNFDPAQVLPGILRGLGSRSDALGLVAADEAARHAGLSPSLLARAALVVGGSTGGMLESEPCFAKVTLGGPPDPELSRLLSHPLSAPADHIAWSLGIGGPRRTVCTACSSGANAMAIAAQMLRQGDCDVVLAGGVDALCRLTYTGFNCLGAVDPNPCRPFDASRAGLTLGEGAAFVVLERFDDARARGANVVAELLGAGAASEAHHITNPQSTGEGAARAMTACLRDAGIDPAQVDYVNAHGTATPLNDAMEAPAIRAVLGAHADKAYVSSTKSLVGHTLGAAGAIEAVVCLIAMEHGFVPPTAGLATVDPKCSGLRHVANASVEARVDVCLSNSFAFGGNNAVLCLGRPEVGDARDRTRAPRTVVVTGLGAIGPGGATGVEALDAVMTRAPAPAPSAPPADLGPIGPTLEPNRARRLNRFARMATDVVAQAMVDAKYTATDPTRVGATLGTGWGCIDESAMFTKRANERGARMAHPAEFPNLVLSAAVGHVSIYQGLKGPTLTAASMYASGEASVVLALDEIGAGRADAMAAAAAEEKNPLLLGAIDQVGATFMGHAVLPPRGEGGACVFLEAEDTARARDARPIATVVAWSQASYALPHDMSEAAAVAGPLWIDAIQRAIAAVLAKAPAGTLIDAVVTAGTTPETRDGIAAALPHHPALFEVLARTGRFEAMGSLAVAGAARLIARGEARWALALGAMPTDIYALLLSRP